LINSSTLHPLIDSANLNPGHWNKIAGQIISQYEEYDGFIVLHGTDTMAYSASMLSYMLQGLDKPVIFTGSQIPLSELRNDALDNLISTLQLAAFHPLPEVCLYFNGRLLRGNRSSKVKATGLDAFDSPNFPWMGQVGIHIELHERLLLAPRGQAFCNPEFDHRAVSILPIYPGISAETTHAICSTPGLRAVILRSYGVGNLPDQDPGFIQALQSAAAGGLIMVNISQCLQAEVAQGHYACSAVLNEMGVIPGREMTQEAAFTKLHFLLAGCADNDIVKQQFSTPLAGEIDE
jgi:L-asparaginase